MSSHLFNCVPMTCLSWSRSSSDFIQMIFLSTSSLLAGRWPSKRSRLFRYWIFIAASAAQNRHRVHEGGGGRNGEWGEKVRTDEGIEWKWLFRMARMYVNLRATKRGVVIPTPYGFFDITLFASGIKFWRFRRLFAHIFRYKLLW